MNWLDFGAGFSLGLLGKSLLKKLFGSLGSAVKGVYKTMIDATKTTFNRSLAEGKFDMHTVLQADFKKYSNKVTLTTWLRSYVKKHSYRGIMVQGHLYYFVYDDPLTKDKLEFYDTSPVVLSFGLYLANTGNLVEYAVNLHYLPQEVREAFMTDIFNLFKKQYKGEMYTSKPRSINEFTWQQLQTFVDKYGIDFAVRSYIPERRKATMVFDYEDWGKACCIQSKQFIGITDRDLKKLYKQHLYQRSNKRYR